MKKVINCYKEHNSVINQKLKEVSVEEGLEIATELFQILNERKDGPANKYINRIRPEEEVR